MRSGHGGAVAVLFAVICHVFAARALAQNAQVVCVDPHNTELVARITGQTRDLPLRVRWVDANLHTPPSESELRALAQRYGADFAVALRAVAGGHNVYVYAAKSRALRTREVPRPARSERFSSSAAAESVALIVRSELSAALASLLEPARPPPETSEGPGGTPSESAGSESATSEARTPEPPPKKTPVAQEPPPAPKPPEPEVDEPDEPDLTPQPSAAEVLATWFAPPLRFSLAASMRASLPTADHIFGAPTLQLQLKLAHIGVTLHGSSSFPARFQREDVAISLRRHAAQLELFAWFAPSQGVEIALGPAVGAVFYQRTTELGPRPSTPAQLKSSPNLSALAEIRWHIAHSVGLSVRMGLDFILRPVRFTYRTDSAQTPENTLVRLAKYEPWVAAGLFVDLAE